MWTAPAPVQCKPPPKVLIALESHCWGRQAASVSVSWQGGCAMGREGGMGSFREDQGGWGREEWILTAPACTRILSPSLPQFVPFFLLGLTQETHRPLGAYGDIMGK